jgi:hypothetical protein
MTKVENRAWFLSEDGRAPLYFHVMYDADKSGISGLDFAKGQYIDLGERKCVYFYAKHDGKYGDKHAKYANREYIKKWDFLPNGMTAPVANEKALKLLEKEAPGEFQAIPVKILLPDGSYLEGYTLINPLNKIKALNEEKSALKEERWREEWNKYKIHYYNIDGLGKLNLAYEETTGGIFLGSEKLRKAIKKAKLVGLQFRDTYGTSHFFFDEE